MKTVRLMFPMMLMITSGCASTLEASPAPHPPSERAGANARPIDAACVVSGEARILASKALVRTGLEVVPIGRSLALGFSRTPYEAVTMTIDPQSAREMGATSLRSEHPIHRVTPLDRGASIETAVDTDCTSNRLRGSTTLGDRDPFVVGIADGNVSWAPCASDAPRTLWPSPPGQVQELRGITLADGGHAVVFRTDKALWFGRLDAEKNPVGPLSVVAERSGLRAPTIAESGGNLLVVWTEFAPAEERWSLAAASVAPCGHAKPLRLDLPAGAIDADELQPALTSLEGGRFLLAWTEGPASSHQVRAATLGSDGRVIGSTLWITSGADAGWARAAVTTDGRGAVIYLVTTDGGFAVTATPIACPASSEPSLPVASTRF